MKCVIIKETYQDGHPPMFAAVCLRNDTVAQGSTVRKAKEALRLTLRIQDIIGDRNAVTPQYLFDYAKAHPEMVFYVTKKQMRKYRLLRTPQWRAETQEIQP